MKALGRVSSLLCLCVAATAVPSQPQVTLQTAKTLTGGNRSWEDPPDPDATHHLIFDTANSLLQRWPNLSHRYGHSIVPAIIPAGTLMHHGRTDGQIPSVPDWLAFDSEGAYVFCSGPCYILSLRASRDLRLAYFDGSSASKAEGGSLDSQDILLWGRSRPEKTHEERERIVKLCEWGKPFGLDGFARVYHQFEILLCDFHEGVEVVSLLNLVPRNLTYGNPRFPSFPQPLPPPSWNGTLLPALLANIGAIAAGARHDRAPGETRLRVDYTGFVTFYDPSLTSLVAARRGRKRAFYRPADISPADVRLIQTELAEVYARPPKTSTVDWGSITHIIVERYSAYLELLRDLLKPGFFPSPTEQTAHVRTQLLAALGPYMTTKSVPKSGSSPREDTTWAAPIVQHCSTMPTLRISDEDLTRQERRLRDAIDATLHEICRRLTLMWVDAFDIESAAEERMVRVVDVWRVHIQELMAWLDWSVWERCNPACKAWELCFVLMWDPEIPPNDPKNVTPLCLSRIDPALNL
ncbi:hypothetical protein BC834DRAFT_841508 [Gloeopeniophorella convolvens]|nr:hypothetical protein BC834DRAFT_841508 [Gloeopeniophorella convolvens]